MHRQPHIALTTDGNGWQAADRRGERVPLTVSAMAHRILAGLSRRGQRGDRGELSHEFTSDVLGVVLDLADEPTLDWRHEDEADCQSKTNRIPGTPREQEAVVAGVEDIHGPTLSSASDILGAQAAGASIVRDCDPRRS